MYSSQRKSQELYFIYYKGKMVGDVALSHYNMPIIIDKNYWGLKIGKRVILALLDRAKALNINYIDVPDIYSFNKASIRLFESCGFKSKGKNKDSILYYIEL